MTRPAPTDIESGDESWDATVNDNQDIVTTRPIPLSMVASTTILAATYAADEYDACAVIVWDGTPGNQAFLYISDGSAWILSSSQAQITPKYAMQVRANSTVHKVIPKVPTEEVPSVTDYATNELLIGIPSDANTIVIYHSGAEWTTETGGGTDCTFPADAPYDKAVPSIAGMPETFRRIVCFKHPDDDLWYTMSVSNKGTLATLSNPAYTLPAYNVPILSDAQTVKYEYQVDAASQLLVYFSNDKASLHVLNGTGDVACFVEMYNYTLPEIK